jgi:hypothetical protein
LSTEGSLADALFLRPLAFSLLIFFILCFWVGEC